MTGQPLRLAVIDRDLHLNVAVLAAPDRQSDGFGGGHDGVVADICEDGEMHRVDELAARPRLASPEKIDGGNDLVLVGHASTATMITTTATNKAASISVISRVD